MWIPWTDVRIWLQTRSDVSSHLSWKFSPICCADTLGASESDKNLCAQDHESRRSGKNVHASGFFFAGPKNCEVPVRCCQGDSHCWHGVAGSVQKIWKIFRSVEHAWNFEGDNCLQTMQRKPHVFLTLKNQAFQAFWRACSTFRPLTQWTSPGFLFCIFVFLTLWFCVR